MVGCNLILFNLITVLLKKFSGEEGERVDVQKLFGYIGLFTLVALWWLGKSKLLICQIYKYSSNYTISFFGKICGLLDIISS